MLQNTNKKSLAEGVTKSQKWKDSEAKEALQSGKDAESQRRKSSRGKGPKMPRKVEPRGESESTRPEAVTQTSGN